jgi:hypothetical protein
MSEIEKISAARKWARKHTPLFDEIIQQEMNLSGVILDECENYPYKIRSLQLCHVWMKYFPDEYMPGVRRRVLVVHTPVKRVAHGCFQTEAGVIIDPLFGQFTDLKSALDKSPELFVNRTLVAQDQEVHERHGIRYQL